MIHRSSVALLLAAGLLIPLAPAQTGSANRNPHPLNRSEQDPLPSKTGVAATAARGDALLAHWLLVENENEIALAQIALQRAQDREVKQFAERMIREHEQIVQKLRPFAGGVDDVARRGTATDAGQTGTGGQIGTGTGTGTGTGGETGTGTTPPPGGREEGARERGEPEARGEPGDPQSEGREGRDRKPGETRQAGADATRAQGQGQGQGQGQTQGQGGPVEPLTLVRDLGRRCLETSKRELEARQGPEFDRAYMGLAVMAHTKANDTIAVFRTHASDKFRAVLAEGQATVQQHLEHARQLAKKADAAAKPDGR